MIIGIDLGTTNSLVSYFDEKTGPQLIPNRLGKYITPSVVSMDEQEAIYVGETAVERRILRPDSAASLFKRNMGSGKKYKLLKKEFLAEELASFILKSLKEDAQEYLNEEVIEAVISVPAYFNDERRRATKRAGELAGLKVERIISEPTAAAIAYGLYESKEDAKFLVFDLGGGTFDVSILERYDTILEVRAVAGDNFLGGENFTEVLENMFFRKFQEIDKQSLDTKTLLHIHKQAERCKMGFEGERTSTMVCTIKGERKELSITLAEYEAACAELFEKMKGPIKRSLSDANIRLMDLHKVVLVGGATKSPIIRRFVSKMFKMLPDTKINPDEAVALGTAIQGAMKERKEGIREIILTDVCPFTLGTEVVREQGEDRYEGGIFFPIIERNTVIPASRTERMYTIKDGQKRIHVEVLQGESRLTANNLLLGSLDVEIPPAKAGVEPVDITYTYDVNAILEVEIKIVSTGEVIRQVFKGREVDMSDEEIQNRFEVLSYLKIHPRDQEENKLLLLRGERMYEESLGDKRLYVESKLRAFEKVLNSYDKEKTAKAKEEFKEFLEEMEEY